MSYSININFEVSGDTTPLDPKDFILADVANPTTIETDETVSLKFKADGMYFKLKQRKGAEVVGASSTWTCPSPNTEATIELKNATSDVTITIVAVVVIAPQVVGKPFMYKIAAPVDTRLVLSKQEMRNTSDSFLPDVYFALCKEDGQFYIYNKANPINEETGKFVVNTSNNTNFNIIVDGGVIE